MQNPVLLLGIHNSWAEKWAGGAGLHVNQTAFCTEQLILSNHGLLWLSGLLFWKLCLLGKGGFAPAVSLLQGQLLEVQMLLLSLLLLSLSPSLGSPGSAGAWWTKIQPQTASSTWSVLSSQYFSLPISSSSDLCGLMEVVFCYPSLPCSAQQCLVFWPKAMGLPKQLSSQFLSPSSICCVGVGHFPTLPVLTVLLIYPIGHC